MLFPQLLHIVSHSEQQYSAGLQRRALGIVHSMVDSLATMTGVHGRQVKAIMTQDFLAGWFQQFGRLLAAPVDAQVSPSAVGQALQMPADCPCRLGTACSGMHGCVCLWVASA